MAGEGAVVVEPASAEDAARVAAMYEWLFDPPGIRPAGWALDRAAEAIRRTVSADGSVILIARLGDELVGFCSAYDDLDSVRFGRRVWIEDLAVDPHHRSQGIGRQLLNEAKRWARSRGAARLALDSAEARTDAHRFYEREQPSWRSISFGWELQAADHSTPGRNAGGR